MKDEDQEIICKALDTFAGHLRDAASETAPPISNWLNFIASLSYAAAQTFEDMSNEDV